MSTAFKLIMMWTAFLLVYPLLSAPAVAQSDTTTETISVPVTGVAHVPCANGGTGEFVALSGSIHLLFQMTTNDNNAEITVMTQPQGVSGIGEATGDSYRATGVSRIHQKVFTVGAFEFSFIDTIRIVGAGPGNNLQIHSTFHVTVTPEGKITGEVASTNSDCN